MSPQESDIGVKEEFSNETNDDNNNNNNNNSDTKMSIPTKIARATARNPLKCLLVSLTMTILFSVIAFGLSDFEVSVDNKGWRSRGTVIANREMQNDILRRLKNDLFKDTDGSAWEDAENNIVYGYVAIDAREDEDSTDDDIETEGEAAEPDSTTTRNLFIDGCDTGKYYSTAIGKNNIFATYKTEPDALETTSSSTKSILDPDVLFDICQAETATNEALQSNGVCGGCPGTDNCLPPFSLLLVLRLTLGQLDSTCAELKELYTETKQEEFTNTLLECTQEINENYDSITQSYGATTKCPPAFQANLIDTEFGKDGNKVLRYSSSYFITYQFDNKDVYAIRPDFGYTDETIVKSTYDTMMENHNEIFVESLLVSDMSLAVGSLIITFTAMGIHTKSFWLTLMGVSQIIFSVPLSYFVYYFIVGLRFFPFLNFIGVFVAAALGADDVFVAVDKWKNARLKNPSASTQDIAAISLPDAAQAMLLTTSTTAVAFFATTICPVTPILCFALFCGLLIMFNYFLNIFLVFPALCLYDIWLMNGSRNCLINFGCCAKAITDRDDADETNKEDADDEEEAKPTLIYRILTFYFTYLKKFRYFILAACVIAIGVCIYIAMQMKLPDSVDVRLLPEDHEYELHFEWKQKLLSFVFYFAGGSKGEITWGLTPADTGARNDPDSLTTLELDETFDPSTTESQTFLLGFCDKLFATDIAKPISEYYVCPINGFDIWLRNQSTLADPSEEYVSKCNGADSVPMSENDFDPCIIAWSVLENETNVLQKKGKVAVMRMRVKQSVGWDAAFAEMNEYWTKYENWMENERVNSAPEGVNKMFHTSFSFWWYDTNIAMLSTAIGAALIAVAFSAIVVLISSRSLSLTLFSGLCVTYVLAATTASLVGFGWNLGFLESVCFAILIGISCDFVIHFGHAYIHHEGKVSRFDRTQYAVTHMGPSILAAAVTTFSAAIAMLFCKVVFFTKFALILLMTIIHATIGSFVVYLVFAVTFGPAEPTKLIDSLTVKCISVCSNKKTQESNAADTNSADTPPGTAA